MKKRLLVSSINPTKACNHSGSFRTQFNKRQSSKDNNILHKIVHMWIEKALLMPNQAVLVAVSGGQDSMFMVHLIYSLQSIWGWDVGIVNCDHQVHSASRWYGRFLSQLAIDMSFNYYQTIAILPVSQEAVARAWRYKVIQHITLSHHYPTVATAHTASDRIETLLYNLVRGSGLNGLQSLSWERNFYESSNFQLLPDMSNKVLEKRLVDYIESTKPNCMLTNHKSRLVRPLLGITRAEIDILRCDWNIPVLADPTNLHLSVRRNRIRYELIPYLKAYFNPKIELVLARLAEIIHSENAYLERITKYVLAKAQTDLDLSINNQKRIHMGILRSMPLPLQRRGLQQFIATTTHQRINFAHIEHIRLTCVRQASMSLQQETNQLNSSPNDFLTNHKIEIPLPGKVGLKLIGLRLVLCLEEKTN